jgi:hypothetical protein
MINSRKIWWKGYVARTGQKRHSYRVFVRKPKRKIPLSRLVGGTIILKWILGREDGVVCAGLIWLRIGINGGLL